MIILYYIALCLHMDSMHSDIAILTFKSTCYKAHSCIYSFEYSYPKRVLTHPSIRALQRLTLIIQT